MVNKVGPKMVPWGTPLNTSTSSEKNISSEKKYRIKFDQNISCNAQKAALYRGRGRGIVKDLKITFQDIL